MKYLPLLPLLLSSTIASAQQTDLQGTLADTAGKPVPNAAVSLLEPSDSTMAFFGISRADGRFELRAVKPGSYLLQVAGIGYRMYYKPVQVPVPGNELGYLVMRAIDGALQEVEVRGQKVPVMLRGDTVEYNAGSFKVKQDAVAEDLLRKMPGIQLDKAGNIKAQGKDVRKVLVDGKEFFGNDPKMATKNLPADAIDKVQVFGKRSDQAQFTGIDDGTRDQTINLQLKAGKRKGYFGDLEAGGGTGEHYKGSAKLYRFMPERQFAALGMINNINQFGFTFQDYLSFQGGLRGLMGGDGSGRMRLGADMPINFGQPVTGLITSGAAGLNYSSDAGKGKRFSVSYMGNGADKRLSEQSLSRNFNPGSVFTTREDAEQHSTDVAHRLNFSYRADMDSSQQIVLQGGAVLTGNSGDRSLVSASERNDTIRNWLNSLVQEGGQGASGSLSASYLKRFKGSKWPVWKLHASGRLQHTATTTSWHNTSSLLLRDTISDRQYQDNDTRQLVWDAGSSIVRKIGAGAYLEPSVKAGSDEDALARRQGPLQSATETDSLSPSFSRTWRWIRPGLSFRHNTQKTQWNIGIEAESGQLQAGSARAAQYSYLKPSLFYQYSYAQGAQVNLSYDADVIAPSSLQMLPVTNYQNPLQRVSGNPGLAPEYRHSVHGGWLRFDQFSSTSLMLNLRGVYTADKISWSRQIAPDLSEDMRYVNVPDDYLFVAGGEYDAPLRRLGLRFTVALEERYNKGLSLVNGATNTNTTFSHNLRLSAGNAKKNKWDIEGGAEAEITDARASLDPETKSRFYRYNGFAQIRYLPTTRFNISLNATVDRYIASSFPETLTVPLINASASYYFLKFNRGVITLDAFDLLNRNTSVQRISQLNYLLERRTNIIRQYVMLTFKYRLSQAGEGKGVEVKVRR